MEEEKEKRLADEALYVGKKIGTGVIQGVTGIAQAGVSEVANELNKGSQMSSQDFLDERMANSLNNAPGGAILLRAPKIARESIKIYKSKDKNLLQKMTQIALNNMSYAKYAIPGVPQAYSTIHEIGKDNPNAATRVEELNNVISQPINNINNSLQEEGKNYGTIANVAGNVGQVVGNMVPSMVASVATKNPEIALGVMGVSAKGQATVDALNKGATLNEAVQIGDVKAMVEVGTEMLSGGVNIFGKGSLDNILQRGIYDKLKDNVGKKLLEQGIKIGGEVVEETVSDILDTLIDKGTVDPNASYTINDWSDTAIVTALSTVTLNAITRGIGTKTKSDYKQVKESENRNIGMQEMPNYNTEQNEYLTQKAQKPKNGILGVVCAGNKLVINCNGISADIDAKVSEYRVRGYSDENIYISLDNCNGENVRLNEFNQIRERAKELTTHLNLEDNELEKFVKIAESVKKNIKYDYLHTKGLNLGWQTNFVNAFTKGKCVCCGYAEMMQVLLAEQGISSRTVTSDTHAWNEVQLNGQWYNFDMTAVATSGEKISRHLKSDEQLKGKAYRNKQEYSDDGLEVVCDNTLSDDLRKEINSLEKENKRTVPKMQYGKESFFRRIQSFFYRRELKALPVPQVENKKQEDITKYIAVGEVGKDILWELQTWDKSTIQNKVNNAYVLLQKKGSPIDIYSKDPEGFMKIYDALIQESNETKSEFIGSIDFDDEIGGWSACSSTSQEMQAIKEKIDNLITQDKARKERVRLQERQKQQERKQEQTIEEDPRGERILHD